ncbi:MAG: PLC-like phosphodiesterase [Lentinula lateritia]|uniref:PLC-like phosphodiesterase n=1 Tax=Lentinula lateritia TaxID=40482 RepID=A0ABQ8VS23_9AGAR|nr:MAG: PLC-like phosphodiesterase [Lentinula lateritia]KAJ4499172.1 PLC-like phosphodiesterase [Lentinula lateritia]
MVSGFLLSVLVLPVVLGTPGQYPLQRVPSKYFDVQAHRGGRGNTVESILPAFAWALIDGATTLELDNAITEDGEVVVWHDENIVATKCQDTGPAFANDTQFPYVGKYIANLTLAQLQTLDCGSKRQIDFPLQSTYPGVRISTLKELFSFAECADPDFRILWNIESKVNAEHTNQTRSPEDFVTRQHHIFINSPYRHSITYQSFDWRTLVVMKALDRSIPTSALVDLETAVMPDNETSPWLAGLRLDAFPGDMSAQIASAAHAINADILSPADVASVVVDPTLPEYVPFTTRSMVDYAHHLGMLVKPWTVNRMSIVEHLLDWNVDGIITDYPNMVRRLVQQRSRPVAPKYPKKRVLECLNRHLQKATSPSPQ